MAEFLAGLKGQRTPEGKKFLKEMQQLMEMEVVVGYYEGENNYSDGTSLLEVSMSNEYGSSTTPARPFMQKSFDDNLSHLTKACDEIGKKVSSGVPVMDALKILGSFLKGLVQKTITDGDFEPNSLPTIRRKRSNHPLIDTGRMRQNVNYKIRKAK